MIEEEILAFSSLLHSIEDEIILFRCFVASKASEKLEKKDLISLLSESHIASILEPCVLRFKTMTTAGNLGGWVGEAFAISHIKQSTKESEIILPWPFMRKLKTWSSSSTRRATEKAEKLYEKKDDAIVLNSLSLSDFSWERKRLLLEVCSLIHILFSWKFEIVLGWLTLGARLGYGGRSLVVIMFALASVYCCWLGVREESWGFLNFSQWG